MPTPITVSVNFIDLTGTPVVGYLEAAIVSPTGVYDLYVSGTGIIAPKTTTSSSGTSASVAIWGNDVIVDAADGATDTYYTVNLFKAADNSLIWSAAYSFTGAGPINLVGYPILNPVPAPVVPSFPVVQPPGGNSTDIQFNNGGVFGGSDQFTFDSAAGVVGIDTTGPTFAAPVVVPAVAGVTTWGYVIIARNDTLNMATSAQGLTTAGTTSLSGTNKNVITWLAVPGATEYDVFCSTSPAQVNSGYLATVSGSTLTYTDTGAVVVKQPGFIQPNESGFLRDEPGVHFGNMTWADLWNIPDSQNFLGFLCGAGMSNLMEMRTSRPSNPGDLNYSDTGFVGGQFIAYANGTDWSPMALNAISIANQGCSDGTTGGTFVGLQLDGGASIDNSWIQGSSNAGVNYSPGNTNYVIGTYGTAQNFATLGGGKEIGLMSSVYGEGFIGTASSQIRLWANFYALSSGGAAHTPGCAAQTASFYTTDTAGSATDFSFYSVGGNNYFGGRATDVLEIINATAATNVLNQSSPLFKIKGTYWNGGASAADIWTVQDVVGAGTNPGTVLRFSHSGTSGGTSIDMSSFTVDTGGLSASTVLGTTLSVDGTFGSKAASGSSSEEITLSLAGTTTDSSANLLPAGAIIDAVVARVTQTISGGSTPTTWEIGDTTTAARFTSTGSALTSGTTVIGLNQMKGGVSTDATGPTQAAADKVRITLDQIPGQGKVRVTVFWRQFTAPTS